MNERRAFFFGCASGGRLGHYLHDESMQPLYHAGGLDLPEAWNRLMDGGLLKNGKIPDQETGKVFWTCGRTAHRFWFAFFWWDNSGDRRGASNSGLYVSGFEIGQHREAFEFAASRFPEIIKRQKHTLVLQDRT